MNDWYVLANDLETELPPLDELSQKRIENRVRSALPRRRKRSQLVAVIAAALLLTACGVAAATGQFSQWFWNLAEDSKTPAASEELLVSMGTVIDQSQTVNGLTITLHGALWDGETMVLSLSLEAEDLPEILLSNVKSEDSWLSPSKEQTRKQLKTTFPYMSDADLSAYAEEYWANQHTWFSPQKITYRHQEETNMFSLQIQSQTPFHDEVQELTLHLENLTIPYREHGQSLEKVLQGPFEFTFTIEKQDVKQVYFGSIELDSPQGGPVEVIKLSLTPFQVNLKFTGLEPMELDENGDPVWDDGFELSLEVLRINGEEITDLGGTRSSSRSCGPDGSWSGSLQWGPFSRVIDPAAVEAIKVSGVWLELNDFAPMETSGET